MDADTSKQDSLSASSSDVQSTPINPTEAATSAGEGKTRSAALRDVGKKPAHLRRRPVHADAQPVVEKSATLAGSSGKPRQMMFPSRPWLSLEGIPQSQSTEQMLFGVARLIATQPGITQVRQNLRVLLLVHFCSDVKYGMDYWRLAFQSRVACNFLYCATKL